MRVLDLGCNDGWMAANLALAGHQVDGIDLNADAVERANARKADYPGMGRFVCDDIHRAPEHFEPGSYDAVYCFEVLEHVPDPRATLAVMVEMVRPGGTIYVSTPDGAYERGNVPGWEVVEHKGHLRAIRPHDLAAWLCELGVVENYMIGPDKVQVASLRPASRRGKVVFFAGGGLVQPRPEKVLGEGLGGSETALCKMAERLARRGYDVRVYAGDHEVGLRGDQITVDGTDPLRGQVLYAPAAAWDPGEHADLFVSSRVPEVFDRTITATRRALWLHDADYGERITAERVARATDVIVLSEFQRGLLTDRYPWIAEKAWVSRNGVELALYADQDSSRKPWVVYSSSLDRGLDVLLECWPAVRERVPDAELHCCYAPVYYEIAAVNPTLKAFHAKLAPLLEQEGVVNHVSLGQGKLARLYCESMVWAYPSWTTPYGGAFPEISCISAMEAQAAGCVPVCLKHGALVETVRAGELIAPILTDGVLNDQWRARFVEAIVKGLTNRVYRGRQASRGRVAAENMDWDGVVDAWQERLLAKDEARLALATP